MIRAAVLFVALALNAAAATFNGSGSGVAMRPYTSADYSETLTATDVPRVTAQASSSTSTTEGRVYTTSVTATVAHDQQMNVSARGTYGSEPSIGGWISTVPSVGTVNSGGFVTHVADGTTTIIHETPYGNFYYSLSLDTTAPSSITVLTGWASGTLGADLISEVDTRIASYGSVPSTAQQILSSANDSTFVYTRNTSNVFRDLDFSGVSVWQSQAPAYNEKFQISLVTPTDAIGIAHETPPVGTTFKFVDNSNVTYTATVAATSQPDAIFALVHLTWTGGTPTTLKVYKVFPSNFNSYSPDGNLYPFPCVGVTQARTLCVEDVNSTLDGTLQWTAPTETNRQPFTFSRYSGDSGMPNFGVVNGDLILIAPCFGALIGPTVSSYISDINTALAAFSGDIYQLTQVSLSGFSGPY